MNEPEDDLEILAGQYVLGTIAGSERAAFEARLEKDRAAREAVGRWADRFEPLARVLPQRAPPEQVWRAIEARLGDPGPASKTVQTRGRSGSRGLLIGAGITAIAAAMLVAVAVLFLRDVAVSPPREVFASAVFDNALGSPRYEILFGYGRDRLYVAPQGAAPGAGRAHELWVLDPQGIPHSLGVLDARNASELNLDGAQLALLDPGATLAISLEPAGGSPQAGPSGPVIGVATLTPKRAS